MSTNWYYVEGTERVGPVTEDVLKSLFDSSKLDQESYAWTKGQTDWSKIRDISALTYFYEEEASEKILQEEVQEEVQTVDREEVVAQTTNNIDDIPILEMAPLDTAGLDWNSIDHSKRMFTIRIGIDRGGDASEYGPFSMDQISKAFSEKRINAKSLIFAPGMEDWIFLADIPIYEETFQETPPTIEEEDRRKNIRKPFVARMLFHNNEKIFEGICRDISVGGMQILISGYYGKIGEVVNMNVHPNNSDMVFVASGKIVRILDGEQGFSIRFCDLGSQAQESISSYLHQA